MVPFASRTLKLLQILWAGPYSLLGLFVGLVGLATGGSGRVQQGAMEFYGGFTTWFVRHLPLGAATQGLTLGHVILGQSSMGLECCREHEHVHIRQFERWGLLMGPAYLGASAYLWLVGRDAYLDNPFEVEAYREAP